MIYFRFGVFDNYELNYKVALEEKVIKCVSFSHFGL